MHYQRWRNHDDPLYENIKPTSCIVDNCSRNCFGHGYCSMHWKRWYRHGDPLITNRKKYKFKAKGMPEYNTWKGIRNRCSNPNEPAYKDYGERGIKVCERWNDFDLFYEDMGKRQAGMTLDRIDNNGDYSPENCRWATMKEQCNNRRDNRYFTINGITRTLAEWVDTSAVKYKTVHARITAGWPIEKALR